MIELKQKSFTEIPTQIATSKASGGKYEEVPKKYWYDDNGWIAEKKLDGTRLKLEFKKGGNRLTTRRISEKTNEFMDRTNNFPHLRDMDIPELYGTILDGEGISKSHNLNDTQSIVGSSPEKSWEKQKEKGLLEYWMFDIIWYKGESMTHQLFEQRRHLIERIFRFISKQNGISEHFRITDQFSINKEDLYKKEIAEGQEGIMLKNLNSEYYDHKGLVKVKKLTRLTMIITGFKKGNGKYKDATGSFGIGFYQKGQLTFAGGLSDKQRFDSAKNPDKYLGKVVEIECQEFTNTGSLRHPRFLDFRIDKNPEDCTRDQMVTII